MRDNVTGEMHEFQSPRAADKFVRDLMSSKTGAEAWTGCLDLVDEGANLRCRITAIYEHDQLSFLPPTVLPFDFRVPREHWRLQRQDGSAVVPGDRLATFKDEQVELVDGVPPGGRYAFGLLTCLDERLEKNYWVPHVVGTDYTYFPPMTPENEAILRWEAMQSFEIVT
ncbi:MAG: hypothetical protein ABWX70_10550 [Hyphomicrobium sp.]